MSNVMLVYVTVGSQEDGLKIARKVVGKNLAACVNLVPTIRSVYRWKGEICDDPECLLIMKTTESAYPKLETAILDLHPYEVAEIIGVRVSRGSPPYLQWVIDNTLV